MRLGTIFRSKSTTSASNGRGGVCRPPAPDKVSRPPYLIGLTPQSPFCPCLLSTIHLHNTIPPHPPPPLHLLHHLLRHPVAPPLVLLSTIRLHIQYLVISPGLSITWWNLETQWNNLHQEQKLRRVSYPLPEFNWSSNPSLLLSVLINSSSCLSIIGFKIIIQSNLYDLIYMI